MSFFTSLAKRIAEIDSLLCVGLDPNPGELQSPTVKGLREFCLGLVEETADFAAAYKPNSAFFEAFGPEGMSVLKEVIASIPKGIPVILDAKRGDIASTAQAYARAIFEKYGAQAVTINPYLGRDALEPFLADPERGVFLLCKTSNPGARDLQDLRILSDASPSVESEEIYLYERVAQLARGWNKNDNLGLVVGATQPEALEKVREIAPDLWILAPGVGTQGGELTTALSAGLREDRSGLLIPISRGISRSTDPRKAAENFRNEINAKRKEALEKRGMSGAEGPRKSSEFEILADGLLEAGCIKFGQFTLKSGLISPIYIDLRMLVSYPDLLKLVGHAFLPILSQLTFDRMAGLPYAALPITTVISLQGGWPMIYPRKESKNYGTRAEIEGIFKPGEQVVVLDDLATTGESKFESIEKLVAAGLKVKDIVVLVDRQSGAAEALEKAGYNLHSVFTLTTLLDYYENNRKVPAELLQSARKFLNTTK